MNSRTKFFRFGFTLLELLIVIAIIGILVTIAAASYSSAQKKARDTRRMSDMKAVQSALEQYFSDEGNNNYPDTGSCDVGTSYLPSGLPEDPKNTGTYTYTFLCNDTTKYCACANLEGNTGNSNITDCSAFVAGTGDYFCVRSLQ